ncbi:MAG: TlpA family protein disulfide reductase [Solirubrobacteraceae bacterium]|jgi:peroxiredoxin|nr:TlpA family protein disulfide reductase [Solirubrobacteraceae bacterium]
MPRTDHYARARRRALIETLVLFAAMAAGAFAYPLVARAGPAPGSAAPDFVLKDTDGRNQRLSEYRGDVVVVTFWASWCGPCRDTLAQLERLPSRGADGGPVVLGVNVEDDAGRAASVAAALGLGYPTLVDQRQAVGRLYDVERLPLTLLLDRDGVVRGAWSSNEPPGESLARLAGELGQ